MSLMEVNLPRILSLPRELFRFFLSSTVNFEPWTCGSNESITDADLSLLPRDANALNYTSRNHHILGLSSESDWLLLMFSRHSYHWSRCAMGGIPSTVAQALRRMNARLEEAHWERSGPVNFPRIQPASGIARPGKIDPEDVRRAPCQVFDESVPRELHPARVETEEDAYRIEIAAVGSACSTGTTDKSDLSTALIVYAPTPVLKLSAMDIAHLRYRQDIPDVVPQLTVILVVVLMALAQHHKALLSALEKLKHGNPLPWIENYEPEASQWSARLRSMSGSTVAEASSREEVLSFSAVSTVYDSSAVKIEMRREVRWAEKRESEEKDTGKEVKRPKLSEYKQVSSGRVATLMDRFERFHI